ncbi:MAG: drug/metabolite transporter (DMT)-like permease [Parasphingorhabdus sp.]|jgi:drug/metabolite transporter (DMT)-like permease
MTNTQALPKQGFILLAAITLFWGLNWPGLKIITAELPVWWFRTSCLLVGGSLLLLLSRLSGNRWTIARQDFAPLLLVTVFNVCGWHAMSAWGVSLAPAGQAAIVGFTMPLWASILAVWLLHEQMTARRIGGLLLGLIGLAVLMGEDLANLTRAPKGLLLMLAAAICWAIGMVLFKKGKWQTPIATHIGWQLLIGSIPVAMVAWHFEPYPEFSELSQRAWIALIYIYLFPMTFCQWAYLKIVHLFPASTAAIGTLLIPIVGVISSAIILDEIIGWAEIIALLLTCSGLALVLLQPVKKSAPGN